MQFRTEVFTDIYKKNISYNDKSFFIGSCFTENIGSKLKNLKFPVFINPFGVLYNPISVKQSLDIIIDNELFDESKLEFYNERWFSFNHHTKFSLSDKDETLKQINSNITEANNFLKETKILFITFGTSWAYKLKSTNEYISNCHKLPAKLFDHLLLSTQEIVEEYNILINKLLKFNPDLKIIFTVSPIRHWKDGAVNNQLSKSILTIAIHEIINQFESASYFPAYEIMMDDLRDYRFYTDDMLHPSSKAIDYIWAKFTSSFIKKENIQISNQVEKFILAKNHKPFQPKSEAYRKFLRDNLIKLEKFVLKYPNIDLLLEKEYFEKK